MSRHSRRPAALLGLLLAMNALAIIIRNKFSSQR